MFRRVVVAAVLALFAALPARAADDARQWDGFWAQYWKDEKTGGSWQHLGVVGIQPGEGGPRVTYVAATYTHRTAVLPTAVATPRADAGGMTWRLEFASAAGTPDHPKPVVLEFAMSADPAGARLEGPATLEGREIARVRFERLPDAAALRRELTDAVARAKVEQRVARENVAVLRESLRFWESQLAEDRRANRATTGTPTAMRLTAAQAQLSFEESRVVRMDTALTSLAEMLVRLDADGQAAGQKSGGGGAVPAPVNPLAK
ncbi:MAG TPA: hypothetical protein VF796_06365 [Humisphaera sp.]